eukprot:scaffold61109_cov22-Cyclotella_meneghiniana.AAC.2
MAVAIVEKLWHNAMVVLGAVSGSVLASSYPLTFAKALSKVLVGTSVYQHIVLFVILFHDVN